MKIKFFFSTIGCYIGVFLLGWLLAELLFTIFECKPLIRYIGMLGVMILDAVICNYLLNHKYAMAFLRKEEMDLGEREANLAKAALEEPVKKKRRFFSKEEEEDSQPVPLPAIDKTKLKELQSGKWETAFEEQETGDFDFSDADIVSNEELKKEEEEKARQLEIQKEIERQKNMPLWVTPLDEQDTVEVDINTDSIVKENMVEYSSDSTKMKQKEKKTDRKSKPVKKNDREKSDSVKVQKEKPFGLPAEDIAGKWMTPFDEIDTGDINVVIEKDK